MIVTEPPATPCTTPPDVIVATDVLLLLHTPPLILSLSSIVLPEHAADAVPVMGAGCVYTVTACVARQTPPVAYTIYMLPCATGYTVPVALTVATELLVLLHTPPGVGSVSEIVEPVHTIEGPEIPAGGTCTLTVAVAEQPESV